MTRVREYIRKRIPRLPNWRWILFHVLTEQECQFETIEFEKLARFLKENVENYERHVGVDLLIEHATSPNYLIEEAIEIHNIPPICKLTQGLLLESCPSEEIVNIIEDKFKERVSVEGVDMFRDVFWDTLNLNSYDFAKYYQGSGGRPKPPPTAGKFRTAYKIFKEGGNPEIDLDAAMEYAYIRTFFRAEELFKDGNDTMALRAMRVALDAYKAFKDTKNKENMASAGELPEAFDIKITYPAQTASTMGSVNYNPDTDDGSYMNTEEE